VAIGGDQLARGGAPARGSGVPILNSQKSGEERGLAVTRNGFA
jgi:hypothetical protein